MITIVDGKKKGIIPVKKSDVTKLVYAGAGYAGEAGLSFALLDFGYNLHELPEEESDFFQTVSWRGRDGIKRIIRHGVNHIFDYECKVREVM